MTNSCVTVHVGGCAIYASGSPQEDVVMNGKKIASSQVGTLIWPNVSHVTTSL